MSAQLEIEKIVRSHVDIRVVGGDGESSEVFGYVVPLTNWISDECARRPILSDQFALSVSRDEGAAYFDSLVDCAHGTTDPGFRERPAATVLSVVVGSADVVLARAGKLGINTGTPLLVWLVGEGAMGSLPAVHYQFAPNVRRTVAGESTSPELFLKVVQGLVRVVLESRDGSCGDVIESAALSAVMRGVGYAVS
ncbi:hypothetical protein [Rhodococcus sp. IEGM 1379]|uniref:hypothetical protein n=1 Tax=Rhodococcus sp. IEGM 1379 TaxID=3047086 RepID=UPI0024B84E60|nr:hypothetical protein [Rhodococcus sp. IEGM 1379]MDI9916341.1 hypothetical protein [Rhodococcus sp. IEGM 1379]